MSESPPKIDSRDISSIKKQFESLIPFYVPEWSYSKIVNDGKDSDMGESLSRIYFDLLEYVLAKLNKTPDRSFVEFLNILGIRLTTRQAANTPVVFEPVDEDNSLHVIVPARTQLVASQDKVKDDEDDNEDMDDNDDEDIVFETKSTLLATNSKISKIVSTINDKHSNLDKIFDHTNSFNNNKEFTIFGQTNKNSQQHVLYLGHDSIFDIESSAEIIIGFSKTSEPNPVDKEQHTADNSDNHNDNITKLLSILGNPQFVVWEFGWMVDPNTGKEIPDSAVTMNFHIFDNYKIRLEKPQGKIPEIQVNGIKNKWIRCRLKNHSSSHSSADLVISNYSLTQNEKYFEAFECPKITNISINASSQDKILPEFLFHNNHLLPKQDSFYPFGQTSTPSDIFYIGSNEAFSKKESEIQMQMILDRQTHSDKDKDKDNIQIEESLTVWEYWNGKGWMLVEGITVLTPDSQENKSDNDEEDNTEIKTVKFTCPNDIQPTTINGFQTYWIRARLHQSNTSSIKIRTIKDKKDEQYVDIDYGLSFPRVSSLVLSYSTKQQKDENLIESCVMPQQCITNNNLNVNSHMTQSDKIKPFKPFSILNIDKRSQSSSQLFFGFDKKITGGPISIYAAITEPYLSDIIQKETMTFYIYTKHGIWQKLEPIDETNGFTQSGFIKFVFPQGISRLQLFGENLYWICGRYDTSNLYGQSTAIAKDTRLYQNLPYVQGIFLNAVDASHTITIKNELLGGSNSLPDQSFDLTNTPLFGEQILIQVNEMIEYDDELESDIHHHQKEFLLQKKDALLTRNSNKSKENLFSKEKQSNVNKTTDNTNTSSGKKNERWVMWKEVDNFYNSNHDDRHYILDRIDGKITFGDGIHGTIPPSGKNNIKVDYVAGGGFHGNVGSNKITSIKGSIPFIRKVYNPLAAGGGLDIESTDSAIMRGPQKIRNRGQAVTKDDFEWLIRERFPSITKVKCISNTDLYGKFAPGIITIALASLRSSDGMPSPSLKLLDKVKRYLDDVSANTITAADDASARKINVVGPQYSEVSVNAVISPMVLDEWPILQRQVTKMLQRFLHPIYGNLNGDGWNYGKVVSVSDVYRFLESISEVDYVEELSIHIRDVFENKPDSIITAKSDEDLERFNVHSHPFLLICSGKHNIKLSQDLKDK